MSSVARGFSQIPATGQYLFVPASSNHGGFTAASLATTLSNDSSYVLSYDGTILNTTNAATFLNDISSPVGISSGDVYRDMGKQLHVYEDGVKIALFRYAQKVEDPNASTHNEGVGSSPNIYICTWQAAGVYCPNAYAMVKVVRTG